jgi:hypothetical protein
VAAHTMARHHQQLRPSKTTTALLTSQIKDILHRMKQQWQGPAYELLSHNCCHFCEAFTAELEVKPIPSGSGLRVYNLRQWQQLLLPMFIDIVLCVCGCLASAAWVNRLATSADATVTFTNHAVAVVSSCCGRMVICLLAVNRFSAVAFFCMLLPECPLTGCIAHVLACMGCYF